MSAWSWWWAYNQDPYLDLKRRVLQANSTSGTDDFFLGEGSRQQAIAALPTAEMIRTRIGPVLVQALQEDGSGLRREASLISLAKLHPTFVPQGASISEILHEHLKHPQQSVADAALFALGLMGDPSSAPSLMAVASDDEHGRSLMGRERVSTRARAIAAFALGELANSTDNLDVRRYVVHGLKRVLAGERESTPDLHVACVTSIGMAPLPLEQAPAEDRKASSSSREGQLEMLREVLLDSKRQEQVRAHVPKAIARLAIGADARHQELALDALLDTIEQPRKSPRLVRYGLIEALGALADSDLDEIDRRARRQLHGVLTEGQPTERGLALVALGLVSGREGEGEGDPLASFREERNLLMKHFVRGKSSTRPWAALALGLQGHHVLDAGAELAASTANAVEATFDRTKSPEPSGAQALALGLRRDIDAVPRLTERLLNERDETLRAHLSISLGLLGERSAIEALEKVMASSQQQPMLLRDSAIALAMLGHKEVVLDLVKVIGEGQNLYTMATAVTALGFVGDARAVEPLLAVLEDENQQEQARGYAAMALGVICEEEPLPWKAAYSNHLNYLAMPHTLNNGDGTGILNFR